MQLAHWNISGVYGLPDQVTDEETRRTKERDNETDKDGKATESRRGRGGEGTKKSRGERERDI